MPGTGIAVADFGAAPGMCYAKVDVTGIGAISSTNYAEAFIMGDVTSDHNADEHWVIGGHTRLVVAEPVNGVGFTIHAFSQLRLTGQVEIRWVWS